nr:unnamed protein product [Digitaria exilis]
MVLAGPVHHLQHSRSSRHRHTQDLTSKLRSAATPPGCPSRDRSRSGAGSPQLPDLLPDPEDLLDETGRRSHSWRRRRR